MPLVEPARRINFQQLTIEIGPESETCLVRLIGELDLEAVPTLERELERLLSARLATVVVDLGELTFIDSLGLTCLLRAARLSAEDGCHLRMLPGGGQVQEVMRLTHVEEALPFIR